MTGPVPQEASSLSSHTDSSLGHGFTSTNYDTVLPALGYTPVDAPNIVARSGPVNYCLGEI